MSNNDQIILDTVLKQQREQLAPDVSDSEFFEVFAAEQALKTTVRRDQIWDRGWECRWRNRWHLRHR